ncbi:MAG: cupin domain-containing protein [Chloroflexi bacterium]|nr:cupin domain-containing protein [Chloroflexota bacterium]
MFHHRTFKMLVALALLAIMMAPGVALGQAPQGPTDLFHAEFDVANHPSQFDEVEMLIDVAPNTSNSLVQYGGDQFATVIQGEVTVAGESYATGKSYVARAGKSETLSNPGATAARLISTILLPKGAALEVDARTSAAESVVYKTQREIPNPPATFKVVQDVLEFAPNVGIPLHFHDGPVLGLVIQGQLTNHNGKIVNQIGAGTGFVEDPHQVHTIGNESNAPAIFFGTILLPPGGEIQTIVNAPSSAPAASPAAANTGINWLTFLGLAAVVVILLVFGGWFLRRRALRA